MEEMETVTIKARLQGTNEYVDVLVDGDYDGEYFSGMPWKVGTSGYVCLPKSFAKSAFGEEKKMLYLHNLVIPAKKMYRVHFKNGDKLDCRSSNLEKLTAKEFTALREKRYESGVLKRRGGSLGPIQRTSRPKSSQYKGVSRVAKSVVNGKKWFAQSSGVGYIGSFHSEEEAAKAYDEVAKKIWGDKAILNFPDEVQITSDVPIPESATKEQPYNKAEDFAWLVNEVYKAGGEMSDVAGIAKLTLEGATVKKNNLKRNGFSLPKEVMSSSERSRNDPHVRRLVAEIAEKYEQRLKEV